MKTLLFGLLKSSGGFHASMSKVVMLLGALTTSAIVLWQAYQGTLSAEVFSWYLTITVGANTANKAISVMNDKTKQEQKE